jgi:hypothetical protein
LRDVLTLLPAARAAPCSSSLRSSGTRHARSRKLSSGSPLRVCSVASTRPMRRSLWLQASLRTNAVHRTRTAKAKRTLWAVECPHSSHPNPSALVGASPHSSRGTRMEGAPCSRKREPLYVVSLW